jgi:tetrahydromethanopterin S-methyltransferase subunit G
MDIAEWNNFFIMVGGGAAALAGLVFIAISINISAVTHDATHKNRAIATLTGFTGVFMVCAFALIGRLNYQWLGAEWLIVTLVPMITYVRVYRRARKMGRSTVGLDLARFIQQTGCYVGQIIGSVLLLFGNVAGLYVASVFMVLSFAFFISGAWLLITGIQVGTHPD